MCATLPPQGPLLLWAGAQSWDGQCDPAPARQRWAAVRLQLPHSTLQHDTEAVISACCPPPEMEKAQLLAQWLYSVPEFSGFHFHVDRGSLQPCTPCRAGLLGGHRAQFLLGHCPQVQESLQAPSQVVSAPGLLLWASLSQLPYPQGRLWPNPCH